MKSNLKDKIIKDQDKMKKGKKDLRIFNEILNSERIIFI